MKTLSKLFAIIIFFSFTNCITAQKKTPAEILGIKVLKEKNVKGEKNEYRFEVYEKRYYINNTKKVFEKAESNYTAGDFEYIPIATLSDDDWASLQQVTDSLFGEYVFKTHRIWNYGDFITFSMRCDMQGSIKDVAFGLPNEIVVPIEVIEKLEDFIKKEMKLHFKINHTNQNANYMSMHYNVQLEPMRRARAK